MRRLIRRWLLAGVLGAALLLIGGAGIAAWRVSPWGPARPYPGPPDIPPFIAIREFSGTTDLTGMLRRRAREVRLEGLEISVPPRRGGGPPGLEIGGPPKNGGG